MRPMNSEMRLVVSALIYFWVTIAIPPKAKRSTPCTWLWLLQEWELPIADKPCWCLHPWTWSAAGIPDCCTNGAAELSFWWSHWDIWVSCEPAHHHSSSVSLRAPRGWSSRATFWPALLSSHRTHWTFSQYWWAHSYPLLWCSTLCTS